MSDFVIKKSTETEKIQTYSDQYHALQRKPHSFHHVKLCLPDTLELSEVITSLWTGGEVKITHLDS